MLEPRTAHLLHVEDDEICQMVLSRTFKQASIAIPIIGAHDGIDALDMLRGTNGLERVPRPFVILLDLNMPRMGGIEFLTELRRDERLRRSVVFVLTTSNADKDKVQAYDLGVAGYILKSRENAFLEAAALLDKYWRVVELPAA